jgi:[glutamine synthetase] adenylyltransferase / [glutamine synthetase]-adenylyl-L-tyrosine phosphorylase
MSKSFWPKVIKGCADPQRAKEFLARLRNSSAGSMLDTIGEDQARILAMVFSASQALSHSLSSCPDLAGFLEPGAFKFPRRKQGLAAELKASFQAALESRDFASALRHVRQFKQREMFRIAVRDLAALGSVPEIIREISDVADVALNAVWTVCRRQLEERHGLPYHQDAKGRWHPTASCALGMGKLGGQELNYSSDVDLLFVYSEEGSVFKENPAKGKTPRAGLQSHQFFNRLAESFIAEVTRVTPEGTLYRIDMRLRPEGDGGPLNRSLASYENYYAQWGQTWERMMLIKARGVAGDEALAAEFLEMIQPFRYPRSINQDVLREVAAMKDRIENEVLREGELDRNVKLGRGGIREVEFIVQSFQLLHAGRQPFLQGAQTLPGLSKLVQYDLLTPPDAKALGEAYCFLRKLEHRLQMEDNLQTHTIPAERSSQERLARVMGFRGMEEFEADRRKDMAAVRRIFEKLLKADSLESAPASPFPHVFEGCEAQWRTILSRHGFRDPEKAFRVLREFVEGPGYIHVSPRTRELALRLLPRIFALCPGGQKESRASQPGARNDVTPPNVQPRLSDPDRVATRLDTFISVYGARSTLFELWHSNPAIFELLLLLFDRSEFLAELAIRTPDLVDELVTSGRLRQRKTAEETLKDLRHGIGDEDQHLWLRRYHQAELMRIGLRDILGLADFEQYLVELSGLADACLQYALDVVSRKHHLRTAPFAVIGLGKLGGAEIDYGSDLDIVFVADSRAKNLTSLARVAADFLDLLSNRTEQGIVFHTDARLRPDGEKGLLVNTLKNFEDYYRTRAQLWEIQSLTRTRPVAGDSRLGAQFQQLAARLTDFGHPPPLLAAYSADWKDKIHKMRMRIEKERTPAGKDPLAIKTGAGGLIDAEFVAQSLCLEYGWQEANTLRTLERGKQSGVLPHADQLINNYRRLRRVEGILRRWSYEGETVLPDDPAPYYRVSVRCGFADTETFTSEVAQWRRAIREVYLKVFQSA